MNKKIHSHSHHGVLLIGIHLLLSLPVGTSLCHQTSFFVSNPGLRDPTSCSPLSTGMTPTIPVRSQQRYSHHNTLLMVARSTTKLTEATSFDDDSKDKKSNGKSNGKSNDKRKAKLKAKKDDDADDENENTLGNKKSDENENENEDDVESDERPKISKPPSKFRKLKDMMWVREALEDLTAAEFACSVEAAANESGQKKKRAVDYEKLLSQLDRRISDMVCQPVEEISVGDQTIDADLGMGRFVYTSKERVALLERILRTRESLEAIVADSIADGEDESDNAFGIQLPEIPEIRVDIPKEEDSESAPGPKLYVRDDGTVDWEGALQDRAALRKFGGAVWARINGQSPDELDSENSSGSGGGMGHAAHGSKSKNQEAVTAKIQETPSIQEAREDLNKLRSKQRRMEAEHTALLNSGISAGQAVANVKLASLNPKLRTRIRQSAEALQLIEQQVSYQYLVYELERIYSYLATELANPAAKGYLPLQDRLNVAEYGLLEGQVESCSNELNQKGVLDADIVAVIAEQMTDFKRRLGIDYFVTGLTFDREAIQSWLNELAQITKSGLMFYVKGCKLFWNDIVYCSTLIARAAQGYTLKPREVRTLRRTFKDIITFIPVVIILIIPLTPVGHVLVFGAIQRFFPDFFPSCFTEQRQNLLQLYETTEFSEFTINESLAERFNRFLEAVAFFIASRSRSLFQSLTNTGSTTSTEKKKDDDSTNEKK